MEIVIQYFDDCPSWQTARNNVTAALAAIDVDAQITLIKVESDAEAERLGFHGSPSILVGGTDLFPTLDSPIGMSCRVYHVDGKPDGSPSVEQLVEVLRTVAP